VVGLLGVWEATHRGLGVRILVAIGAALGFGLLLRRPYDWLFSASESSPGNEWTALLASSTAMWVVVGLWVVVAWWLLGMGNAHGQQDYLQRNM